MKSQQGGVLLYVVILSVVISTITITLITVMSQTTKSVHTLSTIDLLRQQNSAAIRATVNKLQEINRTADLPEKVTLLDRDVRISNIIDENGYWKSLQLQVIGESSGQTHIVSQSVAKSPPTPFNYALYSADEIKISSVMGPSSIVGAPYAMYAKNNITLKHNRLVAGVPVITGYLGFVSTKPNVNIQGFTGEHKWLQIKEPTYPTFDFPKAKNRAAGNLNCYYSGKLSIDIAVPGLDYQTCKVLYVEGDLLLNGRAQFNGLVVVTGKLSVLADSDITPGRDGLIFVADRVEINVNSNVGSKINGIIYSANDVKGILGKAHIDGSVVAKNVNTVDQLSIKYDNDLMNQIPISVWSLFKGIEVKTFNWQETVN